MESDHADVSNLSSIRQSSLGESTRSSSMRAPSHDYDSPFRESVRREDRTQSQSQYSEQLSPDPSPCRPAAEVGALTLSHFLEQNQRLMETMIEHIADLRKQVLQLTKDLLEIKLQQAKTLNQAPVTPANQDTTGTPSPAPQATSSPQLPQQSPQHTHQLASRQRFTFGTKSSTENTGFRFIRYQAPTTAGSTSDSNPHLTSLLAKTDPPSSLSSPSKPALTFNDLAKSQDSTFTFHMDLNAVAAKSPVKSPGGAKSPGVGRSPKTSFSRGGRTLSGGSVDEEVEQGEDIYFKPIFQMPDDYEVMTGEEGEEVKFSHRAKLYRFDGESKQWKERGIGDIKVLYNSEHHKYRIVMRREQVFKVCANHYITPHIDLHPNAGSDRSWVWSAMDASDGTVQNERLAIRFKTPESAKEFKEAVDKAKADLEQEQSEEAGAQKADSTDSKSEEPLIRSCDPKLSSALADAMKSSVSESSATSSSIQPKSASKEPVIKSNVPDLSSALADAIKSSAECSTSATTAQAIGGEVNPEEERDIHFQPIVKLPEKVELVTGEEQEVAEFVGRGKLYRFDGGSKQWKERGVGDIKIMKDEDRDVYRIVMRRDQIHKVCANHYILSSMVLHPMSGSDRAWVWHAMDAADGEPTSEQLAIKFKEPSIAAAFKEKFEEAQTRIRLREAAGGDDKQKANQEGATASGSASSSTGQKGDSVAIATSSSQGD